MAQIEKILTIAIPTYNRSAYLRECLEHICPQLVDEIQLVVRDNCSNLYNYDEFIHPYCEKYGIVAFRNKVNIGGDANIARLYEDCETKWLWVIGDDDYILGNAISLVLKTINNHPDDIYIKFHSEFEGEVTGLSGFACAMKKPTAFGNSFFTSECLVNIDRIRSDMFWHYKYLSLYNAQILRIMRNLINNPDNKCLFVKDELLENHGLDVTWNHIEFVPYQTLIFDLFREQKKILKDNVFKDIVKYCLVYIDMADIPIRDKFYYFFLFVYKFGLINTFRYNYIQVFRIPLRRILNNSLYIKLKKIIRKS